MARRYVPSVAGLATRGETSYLGAPTARDDHVIDELGREEPVVDDARLLVESLRELAWVVDWAEEVRDHASIRTARGVRAEPGIAERGEGRLDGEGDQLERHGWAQPLDGFVRGGDDDEALGGCSKDLLSRLGGAAALDQPAG
jgi:hypothetical protein